jgi:osmotically-inducible protein OsmY
MKIMKPIVLCVSIALAATTFGCAATRTHEASGQYVDDSVITTKVKAAIVGESTLKVSEINVETFKGVVQLSGFVSKADDIPTAVHLAQQVAGVTSVKNSLIVKH